MNTVFHKNYTGDKRYELSNHLGNVLQVITDRKLPVESTTTPETVDYYTADVVAYNDFYPYGMQMPDRHGSEIEYSYGFNGMEKDDEVKGKGNSYDFGARIYDSRVGRWLSMDAVTRSGLSPYNFAANNSIIFVDPSGDTEFYFGGKWIGTDGVDNNVVAIVSSKEVKNEIIESTKLGKTHSLGEIKNGTKGKGFFGIHMDVLKEANATLNDAMSKGQFKEFAKVLAKDDNASGYKKIYEHVGEETDLSNNDHVSSGAHDIPVPEDTEGITIHSHPVEYMLNEYGNVDYCDANIPSTYDRAVFKDYDMNIIVGKNGKPTTSSFVDESGKKVTNVEDHRGGVINFFNKKSQKQTSVSQKTAQNIIKGDKGKMFKKFLKKQ